VRRRTVTPLALWALTAACLGGCFLVTEGEKPDPPSCDEPSDCPDDANPCTAPRCIRKLCGIDPVDDGVAVDDVAGDCESSRCESGEHVVEPDAADDDDGIICTLDSCEGGPSHVLLREGTPCETGEAVGTCTADGNCDVACSPNQDCEQFDPCTEINCVDNVCVPTELSQPPRGTEDIVGDCKKPGCFDGVLMLQENGLDPPPDDLDLCTNDICMGDMPVHPPKVCAVPTQECVFEACAAATGLCTDTPVAAGSDCLQTQTMVCDAVGACVACVAPADCGATPDDCTAWECTGGACTPAPLADGEQCLSGTGVCNMGVCAECFIDTNCPMPPTCFERVCNAGVCEQPAAAPGTLCGATVEVCCTDQTCQLPVNCP